MENSFIKINWKEEEITKKVLKGFETTSSLGARIKCNIVSNGISLSITNSDNSFGIAKFHKDDLQIFINGLRKLYDSLGG